MDSALFKEYSHMRYADEDAVANDLGQMTLSRGLFLFRHGERTPFGGRCELLHWEKMIESITDAHFEDKQSKLYPNVSFRDMTTMEPIDLSNKFQPRLNGQLTTRGADQLISLGKVLAGRYEKLLRDCSKDDVDKCIKVTSTGSERTIESAKALLSGLLSPPLAGAEVSMRVGSVRESFSAKDIRSIPGLQQAFDDAHDMTHKKKMVGFSDWIRDFHSRTGVPQDIDLMELRDYLTSAQMPLASLQGIHETDRYASEKFCCIATAAEVVTEETGLSRVCGPFMQQLVRDLQTGGQLNLYSGHDLNLNCLRLALRIHDGLWPQFASCLGFELYRRNDEKYVLVLWNMRPVVASGIHHSPLIPLDVFVNHINEYFG